MLQQGFLEKVFDIRHIRSSYETKNNKHLQSQRQLFQRKYACFFIFLPDHSIQFKIATYVCIVI